MPPRIAPTIEKLLADPQHGGVVSLAQIAEAHYGVKESTHTQRNAVGRVVRQMEEKRRVVVRRTIDGGQELDVTRRRVTSFYARCLGPEMYCEPCYYGVKRVPTEDLRPADGGPSDEDVAKSKYGWHTWRSIRGSAGAEVEERPGTGWVPRRATLVWSPDAYAERKRHEAERSILGRDSAKARLRDYGYDG